MDEKIELAKSSLPEPIREISSDFESFTEKFLSSLLSSQIECPSCKNAIDFNKSVKWYGPDTFSCGACEKFLSMRLIQRAMRDLGLQSFEITEL
ncbi:MAG: hypothetical protein ACW96M_03165 [Candidatus Thorarchaeota archaeon]|jgi:hypothetical protein